MPDFIIFLGTGKGGIVAGKQLRATGGILIRASDTLLLIDPGPGSLVKLNEMRVNLRDISAILVSHHHLSHSNDLNAIIDAITSSGSGKKSILISTNTVINGDNNHTPSLTYHHKDLFENIFSMTPGRRLEINNIEVIALPASHSHDTIGFKIITPIFTLSYSSDTKYSKDLIDAYSNSDILILNTAEIKDAIDNLSVHDAAKIIEKVHPRLAILTHFGISMINSDPLQMTREIQKDTKVQVIAAKDGMLISPENYAAKAVQRNLKGFR